MRPAKFTPYTALPIIASLVLLLSPSISMAKDALDTISNITIIENSSTSNTLSSILDEPSESIFISDEIVEPNTRINPDKIIGVMIPLSGQNAHLGKMIANAVEMAWYAYAPKTLALRIYDTKSSNAGASHAYSKAYQDNVNIIIGPLTSSNTATVRSNFNSNIINLSLSNDSAKSQHKIFTMGYTPQSQGYAISEILKKQNFERAVIFIPQDKFGEALSEGIGFVASYRIIKTIYYPAGTEDFKSAVKQLIEEKEYLQYDSIILPDGNPETIRILASQLAYYDAQDPYKDEKHKYQITKQKDIIPIIGGLGFHALNGAHKEPPLLNGYYIQFPTTDRLKDFDVQYKKLWAKKATPLARLAYDMTALSIIANMEENPLDKLMQKDGFDGISGTITIQDYGVVLRQYTVMKVGRNKSIPQYSVTVSSK